MKSKIPLPHPRRWLLGCVYSLLVCACSSAPSANVAPAPTVTPDPALLQQADTNYTERADLERVRAGLALLRRARAVAPFNGDAAWRMARLDYTLGDQSKDEKEREAAFREGIEAGEVAVRGAPTKPESHFWLGANYGGFAETQGALAGLSYADKLRHEMVAAQKLDAGFQGGSTYMVLGRLDLELPEWLGGDRQRAQATLEQGLQYGPQNSLLRLELAKAYLANKRVDEARKQLNFILTMTPHPYFLPEHDECVTEARELLKKHF
ncbi:MAG: TRAP transporter TatT component family protein [Pyrinomonadaceae bacterium]